MIVRVLGGDGQFRVDDSLAESLNELDNRAVEAVERGDEEELRRILEQMSASVHDGGEQLADSDLSESDLILPPSDLSLEEARELFTGEGLIPDLPAAE